MKQPMTKLDQYPSGKPCWIAFYADAPNYIGYGDTKEIAESRLEVIIGAHALNASREKPQLFGVIGQIAGLATAPATATQGFIVDTWQRNGGLAASQLLGMRVQGTAR
jgi:hypothetical protein